MSGSEPCRKLRFAVFEVDLRDGELRKHGIKVKLQDQPFQVLTMLLGANGQIVTREALRAKLWPADTFVDFDTGLNTAVRRLRDALGDNAESPRYVETLPRKGYRFICPVDTGHEAVECSETGMAAPTPTQRPVWRQYVKIVVPALLLVIISVALAGFRYIRPRPTLTDKDVIVLADFDNRTGEPVFDDTLRTALVIDLEQSPFLSVVTDLRMGEILKQMKRAPGDRVTAELGREICLRTSSKSLLAGSLTSIGSHYALQLKATDCQTGRNLASASADVESREKVLRALGETAANLRSKLGESLASVKKYDRPLEEVTTSSLEALQAYSEGVLLARQKGSAAAIPFFEHALELDRSFAAAHMELGFSYYNLGQTTRGLEDLRQAYLLRERLVEREKYKMSAGYYSLVTGEIPKGVQELQLAIQEYPRDHFFHIGLGNDRLLLGQWEDAASEYREAVRLQPDRLAGYNNLGRAYVSLNRIDEAQAVCVAASSHKIDAPVLHELIYMVAFLKNDPATMQEELKWAMRKPMAEGVALFQESSTQAYYGRLAKARELSRGAEAEAMRDDAKETAASFYAREAIREAEIGNKSVAEQMAQRALALSPSRDVRIQSALALSATGDSRSARKLALAIARDFPLDTLVQNGWLPTIRAQTELNDGHGQRALQLLEAARPYDLSNSLPPMHAVFIRGQACLAAGDGPGAATEFQNILDHRGMVGNNVIGALAHLYLGRAHALAARTLQGTAPKDTKAQARAAYQDFLTLWKDADPDIPILKKAKAEYENLQ